MKKPFQKDKDSNTKDDNLSHRDIAKVDLYKKGVNQMASENLDAAIKSFDLALRFDPNYVDALLKKGYCHFLKEEFNIAHICYEKALDIDPNNPEAWNLEGLAYYAEKNYDKALACVEKAIDIDGTLTDNGGGIINLEGLAYYAEKNYDKALACVEKAIDIDPNNGMAWYNKACYLSLMNIPEESLNALKRAIEIDIDYAKKAVRDKDFDNVRSNIMFKRVIEIVVLEALRRGYNAVGKIVWISGLDRHVIEEALQSLQTKGLVIKTVSPSFSFNKDESYELIKELAEKLSIEKSIRAQDVPEPVRLLKDTNEHIIKLINIVEKGDTKQFLEILNKLLDPKIYGSILLEHFSTEYRDLRLYNIRIKDKGDSYFNANKSNILTLLSELEKKVSEKIRSTPLT